MDAAFAKTSGLLGGCVTIKRLVSFCNHKIARNNFSLPRYFRVPSAVSVVVMLAEVVPCTIPTLDSWLKYGIEKDQALGVPVGKAVFRMRTFISSACGESAPVGGIGVQ